MSKKLYFCLAALSLCSVQAPSSSDEYKVKFDEQKSPPISKELTLEKLQNLWSECKGKPIDIKTSIEIDGILQTFDIIRTQYKDPLYLSDERFCFAIGEDKSVYYVIESSPSFFVFSIRTKDEVKVAKWKEKPTFKIYDTNGTELTPKFGDIRTPSTYVNLKLSVQLSIEDFAKLIYAYDIEKAKTDTSSKTREVIDKPKINLVRNWWNFGGETILYFQLA